MPIDPEPAGSLVVAPIPEVELAGVLLCIGVLDALLPMVALGGVPVAVTLVAPLLSGEAVGVRTDWSGEPAVVLAIAPLDCAPVRALLLEAALSPPPAQPTIAVTNPAATANVHLFIPHLSLS